MTTKSRERKKSRIAARAAESHRPRHRLILVVLVALAAGAVAVIFLRPSAPPADVTSPGRASSAPLAAASVADAQRLVGRWLRNDAPYTIDIRAVGADGRLEARYLNPQPINVSRASVSGGGGHFEVFVEMNDRGYPGSYYRLRYDAGRDQLSGVYNQLAVKQTFDVAFDRVAADAAAQGR